MKKHLSLALFLPALLLASLLTLAVTAQAVCDPGAGWCPPTTSPPYPAGSVPLNTGSVAQTKAGDLLINGAAGFANGLGLLLGGLQLKITQAIPEGGAPSDIVPVGPISKGMLLVATTSLGDAQWMATSTLGLGGGGGTNYWTQTQVGTSTTFLLFPTATTTSVGIGTTTPNNLLQVADLINFDNAKFSTFLGSQAGASNTGTSNTAVGHAALQFNTTGTNNTAVGKEALRSNTTGTNNTAVGTWALVSNSGVLASSNTAVGTLALQYNTTGTSNTAVGKEALRFSATGISNTAVGTGAGYGDGTMVNQPSIVDNYATFLGYQASRDASVPNTTPLTNITAIGKNARVGASNAIVLGGTGTDAVKVGIGTASPRTALKVNGLPIRTDGMQTWSTVSDARLKKNVKEIKSSLQKLIQLRGVNFEWLEPEKHGNKVGQQMGFVAQDVEKIFPQWVSTGSDGYKILSSQGIDALTVEAIKEQQKEIKEQQTQIEGLKSIVCADHPTAEVCQN